MPLYFEFPEFGYSYSFLVDLLQVFRCASLIQLLADEEMLARLHSTTFVGAGTGADLVMIEL
jgi:hypothetical protein